MKAFLRIGLALCTLLALCLTCLVACNPASTPDSGETTGSESDAPPTDATPAYFKLTKDTVIVRSDKNEDYVEAAQTLRDKLEAATGLRLGLRNDSSDPAPSEILIGETTREVASAFYAEITAMDYGYAVLGEGVLAVAGGNVESTMSAIDFFLEKTYGSAQGDAQMELLVGSQDQYKHQYAITELTIDGNPITDYTILYDTGNGFRSAAQALATDIEKKSGVTLPVAKRAAGAKTPHSITLVNDTEFDDFTYTYSAKDGDITINCSAKSSERTGDSFITRFLNNDMTGKVDLKMPTEETTAFAFAENESYNYVFQKTTDEVKICAGVKRYTNHYIDRNGKPVVAYIIEAKKGAVTMQMGTYNAEYTINESQVLDQILAEQRVNGTDVCAAVNGCLYAWDGDMNWYRPEGLNIKDGVVLGDHNSDLYHSFVLKKDGSYYMGRTPGVIDPADVQLSIGGWWMLLRDGSFVSEDDMGITFDSGSFALARHPRTAIGFREDGTLLLVVVDGRISSHSNGATIPDLAIMFKELGCVDAINIDGGGSSISYTKNYATGEFKYWNRPNADNGPRATLNSTLLIRNPDYTEGE